MPEPTNTSQEQRQDKPGRETPTREQLQEAEAYLRAANLPADDWLLDPTRRKPFYTTMEMAGNFFGLNDESVRRLLDAGELPLATMLNGRWRVDWWGIVYYIAQRRRATTGRIESA